MSAEKKLTYLKGYFIEMTEPISIILEGKTPKKRSTLTLETDDGQILFIEVRDAMISRCQKINFQRGDVVEVGIVFYGSAKNGKVYNNIFLNAIDYVS